MNLLKINLLKALAKEYQTEVLADFPPFTKEDDKYLSHFWEFFLCNKECEFFQIDEEPYHYTKIAEEYGYTEEEVGKLHVGILPLYEDEIPITEEDMKKWKIYTLIKN